MADQSTKNPFDAFDEAPASSGQTVKAAPQAGPAKNPFERFDEVSSGADLSPEQRQAKEKEAAYEKQIQGWMPEARKQAASQGYLGAIGQGITNIPIVGPAVGALGRNIAAATGAGSEKLSPEENTFANRKQNIAAWEEALNRQYGKEYPITKGGTELVSSLFLPAGKLAEGVTGVVAPAAGATGTLAALRSAIAPALGYGAEGAAFGAGSAAAEKAFGTMPESKEPSLTQSTLIGGGLGAALGTAGKAIQYGLEKIGPEWYRSLGKIDSRLAEAAKQDIRDGNVRMDYQQAVDRLNAGQPVVLADMFGPKWQQMLEKSLKGRPEIADDIQTALQNRTAEQGERFFDFVNQMRGSQENPQELFERAQQVAAREKNEAYREALTPGRNHGVWKSEWDSWLKNPDFYNAVGLTEREIISQMTANGVDARNFISPFAQKAVQDPITGQMVPVVNPVTKLPELGVQFQNRIDNQYLDVLQRNLNKLADQRFRAAYAPQGGSAQGAATMRNEIVNTLKKEEINGRPNPFYDPVYKQAHDNTISYRENSNAYDYGNKILSKIGNARDASVIQAETAVMTPVERELATQGLLTDMYQRSAMGDGSINTKKLNTYFNPGPVRESLKNILGPDNFNNLERYIKTEAIMKNTMAEVNKMGRGFAGAQEIRTLLYALVDYKLGGARLFGQWASGRMGDKYAKEMANKFSSGSIDDFNQVYNLLTNNPQIKRSFAQFIDATAARLGAAGAANAGQLQQSGKAMGGGVGRKFQQNKIIQSAASELYKAAKPAMKDGGVPEDKAESLGFADGGSAHPALMIPGVHIRTAESGEPIFHGGV